jgi:hypothetical protein
MMGSDQCPVSSDEQVELFLVEHADYGVLYTFRDGELVRHSTGRPQRLRELAAENHPGVEVEALTESAQRRVGQVYKRVSETLSAS